jgi:hypothetical protein
MANVVRLEPNASSTAAQVKHTGRHHHSGGTFHHVLSAAMRGATATTRSAASAVQTTALQVPMLHPGLAEKSPSSIPADSDAALNQAMIVEGVPPSWQSSLRFIMAQESGGQVNAQNPVHSARGLFQLTSAHYHLNPNGAQSFGNAVEEAQGGIRYIQQRYGTADNAAAFWRHHHLY